MEGWRGKAGKSVSDNVERSNLCYEDISFFGWDWISRVM